MLKELRKKQQGHININQICFHSLETQNYLKIHMLNNHEVFLLFSLRSRNAKQFKANFPYNKDQICPMALCNEIDTQEHCLQFTKLWSPSNTVTNLTQFFCFNRLLRQRSGTLYGRTSPSSFYCSPLGHRVGEKR